MWTGRIVWRGIVYSILMTLGKALVGLTLVAADSFGTPFTTARKLASSHETGTQATTKAERCNMAADQAVAALTRADMIRHETLPAAGFLGAALVARGEIGVSRLATTPKARSS